MMIRRVGFRYRPSVEHLVEALKYKVRGGEMSLYPKIRPVDIVEIEDLYGEGKEPWKVFSGSNEISELHNVDDWQQKSRVKYIVTKIRKIGQKNYCRGAGDGSWDGQGTKAVECQGQDILEMGTLTYEFRGDPSEAVGKPHYYMHEYHPPHSMAQIGLESTDYVLCRVIKDLSKRCHVKKGKKRASSSAITIDDHSKKKAKKSHDVQGCSSSSSMIREEFPGIMCEKEPPDYCENVPGCFSDHDQVLTLDDFPDTLFESCEKEAPNCAGVIDPDYGENVVGCSSDNEQVLTLDDISALLFGNEKNLENDHEAEEVMTMDEYSDLLFGNREDLEQCFSSEFMKSVRQSCIQT